MSQLHDVHPGFQPCILLCGFWCLELLRHITRNWAEKTYTVYLFYGMCTGNLFWIAGFSGAHGPSTWTSTTCYTHRPVLHFSSVITRRVISLTLNSVSTIRTQKSLLIYDTSFRSSPVYLDLQYCGKLFFVHKFQQPYWLGNLLKL